MAPKRRRIEGGKKLKIVFFLTFRLAASSEGKESWKGKKLVFSVSEWQKGSRQLACHPAPFAQCFVCAYAALHVMSSYAMTYSHKPHSSWSQGPERRQEDSGTSKDVSRPGIQIRSQDLASYAITASPSQHNTTDPRHRAVEVFQGSCYTRYQNAAKLAGAHSGSSGFVEASRCLSHLFCANCTMRLVLVCLCWRDNFFFWSIQNFCCT